MTSQLCKSSYDVLFYFTIFKSQWFKSLVLKYHVKWSTVKINNCDVQLQKPGVRLWGSEAPPSHDTSVSGLVEKLSVQDGEKEGDGDSGGESKEMSEVSEATESTDVKDSSSDS